MFSDPYETFVFLYPSFFYIVGGRLRHRTEDTFRDVAIDARFGYNWNLSFELQEFFNTSNFDHNYCSLDFWPDY